MCRFQLGGDPPTITNIRVVKQTGEANYEDDDLIYVSSVLIVAVAGKRRRELSHTVPANVSASVVVRSVAVAIMAASQGCCVPFQIEADFDWVSDQDVEMAVSPLPSMSLRGPLTPSCCASRVRTPHV